MKTSNLLALSLATCLSVNTAKAWDQNLEKSISELAGYKDLSSCEKHVINSIPTKTEAQKQAVLEGLANGLAGGIVVTGLGFAGAALSSASESSSSALDSFGGGSSTGWLSADTPERSMILVGVASGVVIAAISATMIYRSADDYLQSSLELLQFFRDVKNGGVGPQIETRAQAIQVALKKLSFIERITLFGRSPLRYDPRTYEIRNIKSVLQELGTNAMMNTFFSCQHQQQVSEIITEKAMKILIERYNPELSTKLTRK